MVIKKIIKGYTKKKLYGDIYIYTIYSIYVHIKIM